MSRARQLRFGHQAREALLAGADAVADAVGVTLGPGGRYVIVDRARDAGSTPSSLVITNDGVTVARELELEEEFANQGARLVREAASVTEHVAGDGTTTAALLARAILRRGLSNVAAGASPVGLRRGIELAVEQVTAHLREVQAFPIADRDDAARVGAVAAGDDAIGAMVADAFAAVGADGVVNVVHGDGDGDELEVTEGTRFYAGYASPHMITDPERGEATLEDPYILIANQDLTSAEQLLPMLERVAPTGKPLLVLCDAIEGSALGLLVANIVRGEIRSVAVKAPYVGAHRREHLDDVATVTGGESIAEMLDAKRRLGMTVEGAELAQLGRARRVIVTRTTTTIVGGAGDADAVAARIRRLRREGGEAEITGDRRKIEARIGHLAGAIAVIEVGAASETERRERRLRIDDAIKATRGAFEEGVVPGGGVALLAAQAAIDTDGLGADEAAGAEVLRRGLEEPLRRLAANAGIPGSVAVARVRERAPGEGLDLRSGEYRPMIEAGVVDPALVTLTALHAAASLATLMLSTETIGVRRRGPGSDGAEDELRYVARKRLLHGAAARAALAAGIDAVADAVAVTLGPRGRSVIMPTSGDEAANGANGLRPRAGELVITNDGVTVAKAIDLADEFENHGALLVKEIAGTANEEAGDGTTTATLLAQAIVSAGQRNVAAGANPLALRSGIERAAADAVTHLREVQSIELGEREQVAGVAAIAAGDEAIGAVVADAFDRVGLDGIVNVEPGRTLELELELALGMRWGNGYVSSDMATDPGRGEAVLEDPYVLCVDKRITVGGQLRPVLEAVAPTGRPLLIVALAVDRDAISALLAAKHSGLESVAVVAPDFLERRRRNLEDIAVLTGGKAITDELGRGLEHAGLEQLGSARRVVVTGSETTIVDGAGERAVIEARIDALRGELERERTARFLRERLRERLARLTSGVAAIKVGAATEAEIGERMLRVDDAVKAAEAALREGVVPGGGVALLRAARAIDADGLDGDEATGARILKRALEEPFRRIAASAGVEPAHAIERARSIGPREGLDARSATWGDLVDAGIIDATSVTRTALESAASVAKTVLVVECLAANNDPPPVPVPDPEGRRALG